MDSLTDNEVKLFRHEFQKELVRLHESDESPHSHWSRVIMPRQKVEAIIQHLKGVAPFSPGKLKSWVETRKFKVFNKPSFGLSDVLMEPTKEKVVTLRENSGPVFPKYLRVVPREEIFDTLLKIHLKHNHSTLRETAHLVRSVISNIPRYLVHKFILLCPVCSNNGASSNSSGLPYTPSRRCMIKARRRRKLMDQFQVDVLDLQDNPDGSYHYILHCMDHITGFHWLFPLAAIDPPEIAQNLLWGIFSLFGFPSELVSDYGKGFASQVITEIKKLWPDELHIKNYLEGSSYKGDVSRRNTRNVTRFIDHMADQKTAMGDSRLKWTEWLPEIQFMLNSTILDVRTGKTPYEKVFRMHPITPPAKTKLSPTAGSESKKNLPKRRRHHLKYTPEFLTDDLVEQARELALDEGSMMEVANHTVVSDTQVMTSSDNIPQHNVLALHDVVSVSPSHGGLLDGTRVAATQEVVATSQALGLSSGNVVVVDIAGVEHTVESSVLADDYHEGGLVSHVATAEDGTMVTEFVPSGGYSFGSDTTTYSILPTSSGHDHNVIGAYKVIEGDEEGISYDGEETGGENSYMDETSASERCVTLSADGHQLEVAQIKPAPLPVKIGSKKNKGYRIAPISRTVEYVDEDGNEESEEKLPQITVSTAVPSSSKFRGAANNKRIIQLSNHSSVNLSIKESLGSMEVTSFGPGSADPEHFLSNPVPSLKIPAEYSSKSNSYKKLPSKFPEDVTVDEFPTTIHEDVTIGDFPSDVQSSVTIGEFPTVVETSMTVGDTHMTVGDTNITVGDTNITVGDFPTSIQSNVTVEEFPVESPTVADFSVTVQSDVTPSKLPSGITTTPSKCLGSKSKSNTFTGFNSIELDDVDPKAILFDDDAESSGGELEEDIGGGEREDLYLP